MITFVIGFSLVFFVFIIYFFLNHFSVGMDFSLGSLIFLFITLSIFTFQKNRQYLFFCIENYFKVSFFLNEFQQVFYFSSFFVSKIHL